MREIECEGCGQSFACRVDDDRPCWCTETSARLPVPLPGSRRDCRCPDCILMLAPTSAQPRSAGFGVTGDTAQR